MTNFENLSIEDFTGYKCRIDKSQNSITVYGTGGQTVLVANSIKCKNETYQIYIDLISESDIYMYGNYTGAVEYKLQPGPNIITINIHNQITNFSLTFYSKNLSRNKFFTINKIQVSNNIVDINNISSNVVDTTKKNILLIADTRNWCFDNIIKTIKTFYDAKYNIYVEYCLNNPDYTIYCNIRLHLIVKFWYGYESQQLLNQQVKKISPILSSSLSSLSKPKLTIFDPFKIYPLSKKAVCIYDYIHWNHEISQSLNSKIYSNFIENINQCDYILYSCPAILQLLQKQFPNVARTKKCYPIFDGVDIDLFKNNSVDTTDNTQNSKLRVGWVGNKENKFKNFLFLQETVKQLQWVELVVQSKENAVPYDQMYKFYDKVDVIVCLSVAEGTPNPILESSACCKPWISTDVGIVRTLYDLAFTNTSEYPGIIINDLTTENLITALKKLHDSKPLRDKMGNIGRQTVVDHFSWNIRVKQFDKVFNDASYQNKQIKNILSDKNSIVITSTQYTGYGGAATCAYQMHKYLQQKGIKTVCIFFDKIKDSKKYNPDNLKAVYTVSIPKRYKKIDVSYYNDIINSITQYHNSDIFTVYAFNYLAPIISKQIFPESKIVYMITGSTFINDNNLIDVSSFLNQQIKYESPESESISISDQIVPNTYLMKNIFEHSYKLQISDPVDLHEIYNFETDAITVNSVRTYDICFICSDFTRNVKNINLAKNIFNCNRLKNFKKIAIGYNSDIMKTDEECEIECIGLTSQQHILKILSNTKIVVITSLIESYSIVSVEATNSGCIVLANKNCACSYTLNRYYVLDSYNLEEWIDKIEKILNNYYYFKNCFKNNYKNTTSIETIFKNSNKRILLFETCNDYDNSNIKNLCDNILSNNFDIHKMFVSKNKILQDGVINILQDDDLEKNLLKIKDFIKPDYIIFFNSFQVIKNIFTNCKYIYGVTERSLVETNIFKPYYIVPFDTQSYNKLEQLYPNYPNLQYVSHNFPQNLVSNVYNRSVGIYKIPVDLDIKFNMLNINTENIKYFNLVNDDFLTEIVKYDIYFNMFVEMSIKESCENINYILFDKSSKENYYINVNLLFPIYPKGTTLWILNNINAFSIFTKADFYFLRGSYYNFYSSLIDKNSMTRVVFYPATSQFQHIDGKQYDKLLSYQQFDMVLYHSETDVTKCYNSKSFVQFDKFATDYFVCNGMERIYDICYVATDNQPTKNHHLFICFLNYLQSVKYRCTVCYVGDFDKILNDNIDKVQLDKILNDNIENNISYVKIVTIRKCSREDILNIFNKSKINILFSGRDAYPRVITESSACGCFNIALDTLSDGKNFYDGTLGVLIGNNDVDKYVTSFNSLSYVNNDKLWESIILYLKKEYDHNLISITCKQKYCLQNMIDRMYK